MAAEVDGGEPDATGRARDEHGFATLTRARSTSA